MSRLVVFSIWLRVKSVCCVNFFYHVLRILKRNEIFTIFLQ